MFFIAASMNHFLTVVERQYLRNAIRQKDAEPHRKLTAQPEHKTGRSLNGVFVRRIGLLVLVLCWILSGTVAQAQSRVAPPHGKLKLDSYNYLLRYVHPASQAQANYLQNRLFLSGLKKSERKERQERLDVYKERQTIKLLQKYISISKRLLAGQPTTAVNLNTFWMLVSVYGDQAEVYDALSGDVPSIPHDEFVATFRFIQIVRPNGHLAPAPLLLEDADGLDTSALQLAWSSLAKKLQANKTPSAVEVARFRKGVDEYRQHSRHILKLQSPYSGRLEAKKYLDCLRSLADALHRPKQREQIQRYVAQSGYSYFGHNVLGLFQHMLQNRVMPAQGSRAQLAVAEVARPISRLLEKEISTHFERIDSLAAGEGHRPYAWEYQTQSSQLGSAPTVAMTAPPR